jgi:hypothetical protein
VQPLTDVVIFPDQMTDRDSTSPGEVSRGSLPLFPAVASVCRARSETPRICRSSGFLQFLQSLALTPKITMAHQSKSGTTQFALEISPDAKLRFESLHQSMGLRTKAQTFEAMLYLVSTNDKIDPVALERMENRITSFTFSNP